MTTMRSAFPKIAAREQIRQCPVCEQALPDERAEMVLSRLELHERDLATSVRLRLQEEFSAERVRIENAARENAEAIRKEAAVALAKAAEEATEREIAAREQAAAAVRAEIAPALADAERERTEAVLRLEALRAEQDEIVAARMSEERAAIEKANEDVVTSIKVRHFEEKERLTHRLEELARQLENRSADERGESAEVDLFEALKLEFPGDAIQRVLRGSAGPDIVHDVVSRDKIIGRIIYDSKNRTTWRQDYATKLRSDQLTLGAEHAILSSKVFPAGMRQLAEFGGVLIANPARVVALVHLLRRHLVRVDSLRLGNEARTRKMAALYEFMRSERCLQAFERLDRSTDDLVQLQERERREHDTRWRRQEALFRTIRQTGSDLRSEIDRIVETIPESEVAQPTDSPASSAEAPPSKD